MPYVTNVLVCCQTEKAIVRAFMQFLCGRGAGSVHVRACNVRVSVKAQSRVGGGGEVGAKAEGEEDGDAQIEGVKRKHK